MLILEKDERFIASFPANFFQGIIAMGGELKITDRRLFFKPHDFNIGADEKQILFEHISLIEKGKHLGIIPNIIYVHTPMGRFKFVAQKRNVVFDIMDKTIKEYIENKK